MEGLQCQLVKRALLISTIFKVPNCKSFKSSTANSAVIKNCFLVKEHFQPWVQENNAWQNVRWKDCAQEIDTIVIY